MPEDIAVRDRRTHPFFQADNALIDDWGPELGYRAIAVYVGLCRFANYSTHRCFPSITLLAEKLGMRRDMVIEQLKLLELKGLISIERQGSRAGVKNVYTILDLPQKMVSTSPNVGLPDTTESWCQPVPMADCHQSQRGTATSPNGGLEVDEVKETNKVDESVTRSARFPEFVSNYPNHRVTKRSKDEAFKAWKKLSPAEQVRANAALAGWVASEEWASGGGKFVPSPKNYLEREGRYWSMDEKPAESSTGRPPKSDHSVASEDYKRELVASLKL